MAATIRSGSIGHSGRARGSELLGKPPEAQLNKAATQPDPVCAGIAKLKLFPRLGSQGNLWLRFLVQGT